MNNIKLGFVVQGKYTKVILLSVLFTMLSVVAVGMIVFLILYFGMPKDLADFSYSLGNEKFASNLYLKAYEKNNDIELCYKALNLKIKIDDDEGVVKAYEAYLNDDEYGSYNELMRIHVEGVDCTLLERSAILNDKNYLENKYIASLIDLNRGEEAFNRAVANLSNYSSYTFKSQGLYNLQYFVSDTDSFFKSYDGYNNTLVAEMQEYFDKSIALFEENKNTEDMLEKSYLISLGNRIILVGENLNSLYMGNNEFVEINNDNLIDMQNVNDVIKGLV